MLQGGECVGGISCCLRWSFIRWTLGKRFVGTIEFFIVLVVKKAVSDFLFPFKTVTKQGFLLLPFLLFVEDLGFSCSQSETALLSVRLSVQVRHIHGFIIALLHRSC